MSYVPSIPSNRDQWPNIVLIGLTGSGKTTVGRYLSSLVGCGMVDVDARILELEQASSMGEIFEKKGEEGFREAERNAIATLKGIHNHVIITGAGALENQENMNHLQSFGPLVWLSTPI